MSLSNKILAAFHKQYPGHNPVVLFNIGPEETRFPGGSRNFDPRRDPVFWYVKEAYPSKQTWRYNEDGRFVDLGEVDQESLPRPEAK